MGSGVWDDFGHPAPGSGVIEGIVAQECKLVEVVGVGFSEFGGLHRKAGQIRVWLTRNWLTLEPSQ